MSDDLLFYRGGELRAYIAQREVELLAEIEATPEEHVLQADAVAWAEALVARSAIATPQLGDVWMEEIQEIQVDVSHEHFNRAISDPSTPTYIPGYRIVLHLPFEGDPLVFELKASTYSLNPPRGSVGVNAITRMIEYPHDSPRDIDGEARALKAEVERHLDFSAGDLAQQRAELQRQAEQAITSRRQRIEAHRARIAQSSVPVGPPGERDRQSIVEAVVRRPSPAEAIAPAAPIKLEPALQREVFEHILKLAGGVGVSMERAPATYRAMDEEARRDVLLTMLNSHYRGRTQAEAFNVSGKTDLLISYEDKNLFIGECKIWSGAKAFAEAIDQLFSYAAWRDTRLTLIVFVEQKRLSEVVAKARAALSEHPQFRSLGTSEEAELRAEMSWPGDPERLVDLAVLLVHLPASQ
jgi:hypothetical protein